MSFVTDIAQRHAVVLKATPTVLFAKRGWAIGLLTLALLVPLLARAKTTGELETRADRDVSHVADKPPTTGHIDSQIYSQINNQFGNPLNSQPNNQPSNAFVKVSETSTLSKSPSTPSSETQYQTQFDALDDIDAVAHDDDIEVHDQVDATAVPKQNVNVANTVPDPQKSHAADAQAGLNLSTKQVPLNAIAPETVQTFVEVIDTIRHAYVKPINDEALFQYAITGMLQKLDAHAEYLTPSSYERLRGFTDGEIAQVGLSAGYDSAVHAWVIDTILPKSSAKEAGIKLGERLLKIKTVELMQDMSRQDIEQLLSGIAGSHVQVVVADARGNSRILTMERNLPKSNKLEVTLQNGVAIVRLPIFQNSTRDQLVEALRQLDQPIIGIVLDVRNNPGGVLSAAIDVASLFIEDNDLIQVRNRTNSNQIIRPNGTPYLAKVPVVLLQNRYSASASEVLASSFKSNERALIIGEKSFGKGTVQEVIPLDAGGAVKLTVAEYRSSQGELIDGVGIAPNISLVHDGANWEQQAVNILLAHSKQLPISLDLEQDAIKRIGDY